MLVLRHPYMSYRALSISESMAVYYVRHLATKPTDPQDIEGWSLWHVANNNAYSRLIAALKADHPTAPFLYYDLGQTLSWAHRFEPYIFDDATATADPRTISPQVETRDCPACASMGTRSEQHTRTGDCLIAPK